MSTPKWTEATVRQFVVRQFREVLPDSDLEGGDNFFRHGGNSLDMIRLIEGLNHHGLPLTARDFITRPTRDGVVASVMARLSGDG